MTTQPNNVAGEWTQPTAQTDLPLFSDMASDPDMAELLEGYIVRLGEISAQMQAASDKGDLALLISLAHQLKGSAGSYGFGSITDAARNLENRARTNPQPQAIAQALAELVTLCRRAAMRPAP